MNFYLKRLLDYIRLQIASGTIDVDSPVGIAYNDYLEHAARQNAEEAEQRGGVDMGEQQATNKGKINEP